MTTIMRIDKNWFTYIVLTVLLVFSIQSCRTSKIYSERKIDLHSDLYKGQLLLEGDFTSMYKIAKKSCQDKSKEFKVYLYLTFSLVKEDSITVSKDSVKLKCHHLDYDQLNLALKDISIRLSDDFILEHKAVCILPLKIAK